jgi:hypothetical protein
MPAITPDLKRVCSLSNLRKAWSRINSSRKYDYKNYFRHLYKSYEISIEDNLRSIRERLKSGTYRPSHAVKIYLPKKSGLLRVFSLLSVEDQIVYQAFGNVVAENLNSKARAHYNSNNFGHHFAGVHSEFFFKPWEIGYNKFKTEFKKSFRAGLVYTASFDYTAFYDTVDHSVLSHLLEELKFTPEFCQNIIEYLRYWTCTEPCEAKYHSHGIPQGPLTSGIFGEVMLTYVDTTFCKGPQPYRYMRYVDDIRILSVDELGVKKAVMRLDILSKRIGLFPQASKLSLHKITDIDSELKNVSSIGELNADKGKNISYLSDIRKIIKEGKVVDETSFKYMLARVPNETRLEKKCVEVLLNQPNLCDSVIRYLSNRDLLNDSVAELILKFISETNLYEEVTAKCLQLTLKRIKSEELKVSFSEFCLELLRRNEISSPNLKAQVYAWVLKTVALRFNDLEKILASEESWIIHNIINEIDLSLYGKPSYASIINGLLTHKSSDVHAYASYLAIESEIVITANADIIGLVAKASLRKAGKISGSIARGSTISESLSYIVGLSLAECNWRRFFGINHGKVEHQILMCKSYIRSNPTAFINQLDSFNELVLNSLFPLDQRLGNYQLGGIGGFVNTPTCSLAKNHPDIYKMCEGVHLLRKESELSHPVVRKSTKDRTALRFTRTIAFSEVKKLKPVMQAATVALVDFVFQNTNSLKLIKGGVVSVPIT